MEEMDGWETPVYSPGAGGDEYLPKTLLWRERPNSARLAKYMRGELNMTPEEKEIYAGFLSASQKLRFCDC